MRKKVIMLLVELQKWISMERTYCLSPGEFLYIPPDSRYQLKNVGNENLIILVIFSFFSFPGALEKSVNIEEEKY